ALDHDLALLEDRPGDLTDASTEAQNKLIQEESRLKKQRVHSVNLVNQGVDKKLKPKAKKFKKKQHVTTSNVSNGEKKEQQNNKCNFCKKRGHFQKDCPKRKAWVSKPNIARKVSQEAAISLKLYTLICVDHLILHPSLEKKHFITFKDDFSHYEYVYLLHEKSQFTNALKVFLNEAERQLDRKVKIVRSDRGGEYYGFGQCPGPFKEFLERHDICAQYTMPGTPQQNGLVERRNRTLMKMVRSMIHKSSLPKSLWIYHLEP
ncbi:retrovirus-related pol polyprotein from transposon TNT 1-94, partial [Tanacetum coccineum]